MTDHEDTLTFECELDEPPARVWRALTEPELLAQWLMQNDFAATEGHRCTFREQGVEVDCEVLEVERERALKLRWREGRLDSVVTFTLTPALGGGTLLRLTHGGVERLRRGLTFLACAPALRCAA
jgi:uncharacterized protein YndB with AHSA1/START domain